jgi:hypothetical protein
MKRAQRAAAELERAWYRWHSGRGPHSGPMLTVTSYVGYSLTEPVGEPRVVLGVTASDAELLADLLEQRAPAPLPVPPQAPPVLAEPSGLRADTRGDARGDVRGRQPEPTVSRPTAPASGASGQAVITHGTEPQPVPADPGGPAEAGGTAPAPDSAPVADRANGQRRTVAEADEASGDAADGLRAHLLPSPAVPPGTGPLALAASAARLEAETRIRAARSTPDRAQADSESARRPEAAAGARTRYSADRGESGGRTGGLPEDLSEDPAELASAWGGPAFGRAQEDRTALVRLRRKLAGSADDRPMMPAEAAEGRRARPARAYPVQRMPRMKRQSALPGA